LTIHGHTERSYSSGTPPNGLVEGSGPQGSITEGGEGKASEEKEKGNKSETSVEKSGEGGSSKKPAAKYWVSERSVGQFSRTFTFPNRVDQDNVKASMKNGILSVIVPKSKKPESRKITIS